MDNPTSNFQTYHQYTMYRLNNISTVDRIVDGVGQTARAGGRVLRRIQTGRVQNYLLVALVTVLMLLRSRIPLRDDRAAPARPAKSTSPSMTYRSKAALTSAMNRAMRRNWFHSFVGHEFPATPLSVPVMLLSSLLAVGGLFLGWLVYGRKPLTAGQPDPLVKALGPVHTVLKNKYYFDELYHATVVRGSLALADIFFKFDNRWVIDPIVNLVGRIGLRP